MWALGKWIFIEFLSFWMDTKRKFLKMLKFRVLLSFHHHPSRQKMRLESSSVSNFGWNLCTYFWQNRTFVWQKMWTFHKTKRMRCSLHPNDFFKKLWKVGNTALEPNSFLIFCTTTTLESKSYFDFWKLGLLTSAFP